MIILDGVTYYSEEEAVEKAMREVFGNGLVGSFISLNELKLFIHVLAVYGYTLTKI